jgi:prepilin-type N-terminal cleavage/methylation domain-containing protein
MTTVRCRSSFFSTQRGISLLELSIVLVIIGLGISGVLAGRHLLRQSELQEVIKEIASLRGQVLAFRDKYGAAPGDISTATLHWTSGTANGNGDGHITNSGGPTGNENFRAWQHLVLAQLMEGGYTGAAVSGGNDYAVFGTNVPVSTLNSGGAGYYLDYASWYSLASGDAIVLGGSKLNDKPLNSALTPEDMANLDRKLDDGQPRSGIVIADSGADAPANCDTGTPQIYNFANKELSCRLIYFYPLNDFTP